jgi:hypothetical protein
MQLWIRGRRWEPQGTTLLPKILERWHELAEQVGQWRARLIFVGPAHERVVSFASPRVSEFGHAKTELSVVTEDVDHGSPDTLVDGIDIQFGKQKRVPIGISRVASAH